MSQFMFTSLGLAGRLLKAILLVTLLWGFLNAATWAATHTVRSAKEIESLVKSTKLAPGDTIIWADGEYADAALNIDGVDGTKVKPITLRAASPGGVVLRGKSHFDIGASWWVVEGFHFDGSVGGDSSYNTIQFRSRSGKAAHNVRLTNCALTDLASKSASSKWVLLYGRFNTVEHCHFSGKKSKGALVTVELGYLGDDETAEHRVEWNYFGDVALQEGSDNETIRVGYSGDQNKPATCLIRHNLFVRCNGENEIISNKSSFNVYRANTFRQCDGALVLRHGHHARVEGNFFFGEGAQNAGGIRVVDSHHVIVNNYLQDLTGTTWNAAFSILGGKQMSGGQDNGYQAVDGIVVAHNTIINSKVSMYFNDKKGARSPTGVIANNLVASKSGPLIVANLSTKKLKWAGNLFHGAELGAEVNTISADPRFRMSDGLLRPNDSGPVSDKAAAGLVKLEKDIDGQLRPKIKCDIGADEVAGAVGPIVVAPLQPADVGVTFLRN